MSPALKRSGLLLNISFISLMALLAAAPLIFLPGINNGYELAKAASLKMLGGFFIIVSVIYLTVKLFRLKNKEHFILFDAQIDPVAVLFLIAAFLSTVFSINPHISYFGGYERQLGFITYLYIFLVYFFASQALNDSGKTAIALKVMEVTAIIVAVYAVLQALQLDPFGITVRNRRAHASFGNVVFAGGFLILVYPVALIEFIKSNKKLLRSVSPLIITAGIVVNQTRTAYVAFVVETVIVLFVYQRLFRTQNTGYLKSLKNIFIIFGLAAMVIVFFVVIFPDNVFVERIIKISDLTQSPRWYVWRDSFKAFWLHPALGSGIGTFANVFEYVVTPETRGMEVNSRFDNPHNNFLQFLCTMGIVGIAAYLLALFQSVRTSIKMLRDKVFAMKQKLLALALLALFCGYIIYGLADFDDLVILLYLFMALAILKVSFARNSGSSRIINFRKIVQFKIPILFLSAAIIIYSVYNIYDSYKELKADSYYKEGIDLFYAGDLTKFVNAFNSAVLLNPGCSDYGFSLAYDVYEYCSGNTALSPAVKNNLLTKAEAELNRVKDNLSSNLQYEALLAMIYYELGKKNEADRIRDKVLMADSITISFRNNLARYYLKSGEYEKMTAELNFIHRYDPQNESAELVELFYFVKTEDLPNAELMCQKILKFNPMNKTAEHVLAEIEKKKKGSP